MDRQATDRWFVPEVSLETDVVIVGGGVAGLWTAARLRCAGFGVLLLETHAFGAGQSIASQGIIHGGIKYVLGGAASRAARLIAPMPGIWRSALRGGEIDLRATRVLAEHQYLWSAGGVGARLTTAAAASALRSDVVRLSPSECEGALRRAPDGTTIYRVEEQVLEPASLMSALASGLDGCALLVRPGSLSGDADRLTCSSGEVNVSIRMRQMVVAAGGGTSEVLVHTLGLPVSPQVTQKRPLQMVMARGPLEDLYAHCIRAASDVPRFTVTTGRDAGGTPVWYLGGDLAEKGVDRSEEEQILAARNELATCMPWLDTSELEWGTLRIDRAESRTARGSRPDGPVVQSFGRVHACWPTKLAFAPLCATMVLQVLGDPPQCAAQPDLPDGVARPEVATLPWDEEGRRWI